VNRIPFWPAVVLSAASLATPTFGQYKVEQPAPKGSPVGLPAWATNAPPSELQENVEILRRLLDGAFAETYGFSSLKATEPPARFEAWSELIAYNAAVAAKTGTPAHAAPHVEGVYLKDYGVAYTTTLPSPPGGILRESYAAPGNRTAPDPWERMRKEIRGETPDPDVQTVAGHPPLDKVILKVLADNGRHFTSLGDGERITVAVTLRGAANCTACHQNPGPKQARPPVRSWEVETAPGTGPGPGASGPPGTIPGSSAAPPGGISGPSFPGSGMPPGVGSMGPSSSPPPTPAWLTDLRNDVLLGDLHLKQGKAQEALAAYQKAMQPLEIRMDGNRLKEIGWGPNELPVLLTAVDLCNKMAQAYVALGDDEAAKKQLANAGRLAKEAENLTGGPATTNPKTGLPAKLVITVSKKLLDDVGSGKLTLEAFCQAATVEYTAAPADKK